MTLNSPIQETLALGPSPNQFIKSSPTKGQRIVQAAGILLPVIEQGLAVDAAVLRSAMTTVFGASDNEGAWVWKDAYEACEATFVLFLRKYCEQMRSTAPEPRNIMPMINSIAALFPTQTRRSDDSLLYQQFSTPPDLAFIAAQAARIDDNDLVMEPSAGTGMLAIHALRNGSKLILNELADTRADILHCLFPQHSLTRHNAELIHDYLKRDIIPTLVLMNPPFSAKANAGTVRGTDMLHIISALRRLAPGGRLVAITGANCTPTDPGYAHHFATLAKTGRIVFSASLSGRFFRRHGTSIETRLTVIDKVSQDEIDPSLFFSNVPDAHQLLDLVERHVPARLETKIPTPAPTLVPQQALAIFSKQKPKRPDTKPAPEAPTTNARIIELDYQIVEQTDNSPAPATDNVYEPYELDAIRIPGAQPHRSKLVQSAAMASVRPPAPSYRPTLPENLITDALLSDAQLETVIYAGQAHQEYLSGRWRLNDDHDVLNPARDDDPDGVKFRRGFMLGDGTGVGKGRQVCAIILDNWLKGRRRALWISKNDPLLDDAQRDWSDLGQEKLQIIPQGKYALGTPITLSQGILFTTYGTLRSAGINGKKSRLDQLIDWLGPDYDGVIVFDESHAMGNAAPGDSDRGKVAASLQGLAGLRLQNALPHARVVYASATGASQVENLAYASRLGLWGSSDFPFKTRAEFVDAMHSGGLAAMEVLARDLKALGLYTARNLSYEGVEVDFCEHGLSPQQIEIYNEYADAFEIIHQNLEDALEASQITAPEEGTLNRQAKSAARSAFESNKQRFFNHLITSMKMPTLIKDIDADLAAGRAPVIQLVTTSEALMERRIALIPPSEWGDLNIDITPREYVLCRAQHNRHSE